jgi:hypothetical protein
MFDLSLLTERADEEELEEKRRHYEDALSRVTISTVNTTAVPLLTTTPLGEPLANSQISKAMSSSNSDLRKAFESMRVAAMRESLVDDFSPLP